MIFFRKHENLSRLEGKNFYLLNAEVLITQKCNLKCEHCLRGEGSSVDVSDETLNNLFKNIKEIGNLCLGGGEPSLLPERLNKTLEIIKQNNVIVHNINVTSNGLDYNEEFADILLKFREYVKECRQKQENKLELEKIDFELRISLDDFHLFAIEKQGRTLTEVLDNIKKYQEKLGEDGVRASYGCDYDILNVGRAMKVNTAVPKVKQVKVQKYPYLVINNHCFIGSVITMGSKGDIIPTNIPFEQEQVRSAGNVNFDKFSSILSNLDMIKVENDDMFDKVDIKQVKKMGIPTSHIKRYEMSKRFEKRKAIEMLLIERNQKLKEDYETFEFEPAK